MNEQLNKHPSTDTDATIMIISASDSAACAGMQADIRTCVTLHTRATTVVTAITAQNSLRMEAISAIEPDMIIRQMRCAAEQVHPEAVKIGLLPTAAIIRAVATGLREIGLINNVVADTVAAPTAIGDFFSENQKKLWRRAMIKDLLPICSIATPNLPELNLLGEGVTANEFLSLCCCRNLLVKGGHGTDNAYTHDTLWRHDNPSPVYFTSPRIQTRHLRGTGCVLSTAIACYIAKGYEMQEAVRCAHHFLHNRIECAANIDAINNESVI